MGRCAGRAVAADVDHRGGGLAKLAEQIERLGCPSGHELELVAKAAEFQLSLDRARFAIERDAVDAERIGGKEQDRVLHRRSPHGISHAPTAVMAAETWSCSG